MHKSSQNLEEAQSKNLFQYEYIASKSFIQLDSGSLVTIKNAWVENSWQYECINNVATAVKNKSYQFVIDADYKDFMFPSQYSLENIPLGSLLCFSDYSGNDTLKMALKKNVGRRSIIIDSLVFIRK